ncbi:MULTISPECIES: hypothetical protein [Flavobacterium]|uniref:Uncharacterized protein n=1 Tax=Flavobacterium jumunjinense TaxID=998845 RepID=A0ABV5GVJ1_9FLAO|nr:MULTISPECIES: hypothetical protein [Flavobacterium]
MRTKIIYKKGWYHLIRIRFFINEEIDYSKNLEWIKNKQQKYHFFFEEQLRIKKKFKPIFLESKKNNNATQLWQKL